MSYKPPGPEEMAGPTGVGPRDRGLVRRSFRIILGVTISLALLVLFMATAAMAWIVLFSGPPLQFRSLGRGHVAEVVIPKDCVEHIERLQLVKGDDGEVIWDIAAGEESIILTVLRFTLDGNLVLPDPTSDAAVLAPTTGTTFDLDPGTRYTLTMWGDEKAKRHCSWKGSFSLAGETPGAAAAASRPAR